MNRVLDRRRLLRLSGAAIIAGVASPALAGIGKAEFRAISLNNLHTGERATIDYWADGGYIDSSLQTINHLLRDHRTGQVHAIAPNLLDLVHQLQSRLGSKTEVQVISGYRSPATNAALHQQSSGVAVHSLHMEGMAMDIRLSGIPLDRLHKAALAMRAGGVGYYPDSDFVHVDVGRVRSW